MQKAPSIYKFYPEWVRVGTRPGLRCTKEIAHGFSWGRNCAAQNPQPLCPAGGLCHRLSTQAAGIPGGLSLLAMTMGCQFLPRPVGWDPSLIFDFNMWVRIYFFVSVLFHLM